MTDRLEWRTVDNNGGADHHYTDRADVDDGYLLRTLQMDGEGNWLIVAEHHVKVARLLAGGEGETIERPYLMELANLLVGPLTKDDFFTGPDLIAEVKSRASKCASLTDEVERLTADMDSLQEYDTKGDGLAEAFQARDATIATLKRERDEAVSWCKANKQFLESVTLERDHAQQVEVPAAIERAEDAERERDEARAALAIIVANAEVGDDPRMNGMTECYLVPLDDIDAARALSSSPAPEPEDTDLALAYKLLQDAGLVPAVLSPMDEARAAQRPVDLDEFVSVLERPDSGKWEVWIGDELSDVYAASDSSGASRRADELRRSLGHWFDCHAVPTMQTAPAPEPEETDEPAGEAGDEGAGESGQTPGGAGAVEHPPAPADGVTKPEPAPATPTTALLSYAPRSTSGIGITFAGSVLPLTRQPDGAFLPGCSYVLYTSDTATFSFLRDARATDGMAKGTIRWRVNNGGDPFGDDRASSSKAVLLKADTVVSGAPTWPAASGPISVADLGPPLTDADGSKWWRVEAWSDVSATEGKDRASDRATIFFVCVLAPGATAPRPPAVGYHASEPIVMGSPVVHPIKFVTDSDPSPGEGESPEPLLFRDDAHLAQILANADPRVKATALALYRDGFQSKRSGTYFVDRTAGHWLTLRNQQPQYSALCTAVRLLTGEATDEDKTFLRIYALNNGLSAPEIAIGEHGDTTALWGGFSYDCAFEETFSVACVYSWGRRFGLWTSSEEARIRDQLARFCWTSLQLHRNPYRKWIHANGSTQAMWESARDQVSGLVSLVMPGYFSKHYGAADEWSAWFIDNVEVEPFGRMESRSGLFGLLSDEPRWNDDGGRYFTSHNCAGPLALTLACLANAGEEVPDHYEDALILALDGKLPGAEGVRFWSPLLVNDNFPEYRAWFLARHGEAAVVAAQTHISTGNNDDVPGGLGAGTAVLGLLLTEVGS